MNRWLRAQALHSSAGYKKPLVIDAINGRRPQVLVWLDVAAVGGFLGVWNRDVGPVQRSVAIFIIFAQQGAPTARYHQEGSCQ